jgi:hypothetical protein
VHSRYVRHVADEAVGGRPVVIDLSVRRLYCENPACPKTTFVEQIAGLTERYQRRTPALRRVVAVALAGSAGARLHSLTIAGHFPPQDPWNSRNRSVAASSLGAVQTSLSALDRAGAVASVSGPEARRRCSCSPCFPAAAFSARPYALSYIHGTTRWCPHKFSGPAVFTRPGHACVAEGAV